jgi:hypothetical protein
MSDTKKKIDPVKLSNVRVAWARVIRPGKAYDESHPDEWTVNMYVTPEDSDLLQAHGCAPATDKEGYEFFRAKRKTVTKSGEAMKPPFVRNRKKEPFAEEIGNGSICNVVVSPFPWSKGNKKGVTLFLHGVQVLEHVTIGEDPAALLDNEDGDTDPADLL